MLQDHPKSGRIPQPLLTPAGEGTGATGSHDGRAQRPHRPPLGPAGTGDPHRLTPRQGPRDSLNVTVQLVSLHDRGAGPGQSNRHPVFQCRRAGTGTSVCVRDAGETGTSSGTALCALAEHQEFRGLDHLLGKAPAPPPLCSAPRWEKPPPPKGNKIKSRREVLGSRRKAPAARARLAVTCCR